jgi:hypothetical protein
VTEEQALWLEQRALEEFQGQAHLHLQPNTFVTTPDTLSWWTLMQHHGAPTRLLDWTASVFVAAYFAALEWPEKDGAVWAVHVDSFQTCMKNRYGQVTVAKTEEENHAQFLQPEAPLAVTFFKRVNMTDRMVAQQGLFSICRNVLGGHEEVLVENLHNREDQILLAKYLMPAGLKPTFLRKLRAMNITARSLFPGLDGLARSAGELLRLGLSEWPCAGVQSGNALATNHASHDETAYPTDS